MDDRERIGNRDASSTTGTRLSEFEGLCRTASTALPSPKKSPIRPTEHETGGKGPKEAK